MDKLPKLDYKSLILGARAALGFILLSGTSGGKASVMPKNNFDYYH